MVETALASTHKNLYTPFSNMATLTQQSRKTFIVFKNFTDILVLYYFYPNSMMKIHDYHFLFANLSLSYAYLAH